MKGLILLLLFLIFLVTSGNTLECKNGFGIESKIFSGDYWNIDATECLDDAQKFCLRGKIALTVLNKHSGNFTGGKCATKSECINQTCDSILNQFEDIAEKILKISFGVIPYKVITCDFACCEGDNCNNDAVRHYKKSQQNIASTTNEIADTAMATTSIATSTSATNDGTKRFCVQNTKISALIATCLVVVLLLDKLC